MKLVKKVIAIYDGLNYGLAWGAGGLFIFMMLLICTDVSLRYFLNKPQAWVLDITRYCLLFATFLATAWLLRRDGHIRVDIVVNSLNSSTRALLEVICSIMGVITCLPIIWGSALVTLDYMQKGTREVTILEAPKAPLIGIICLGFFLLLIQFLIRVAEYLRSSRALSSKGHRDAP